MVIFDKNREYTENAISILRTELREILYYYPKNTENIATTMRPRASRVFIEESKNKSKQPKEFQMCQMQIQALDNWCSG